MAGFILNYILWLGSTNYYVVHWCNKNTMLVGGLEHVLFFHILGISSSQLTNIFQRGWNHQPACFPVRKTKHISPWCKSSARRGKMWPWADPPKEAIGIPSNRSDGDWMLPSGIYSDVMVFYSDSMGYYWDIPSGYVKIAIDNGHL